MVRVEGWFWSVALVGGLALVVGCGDSEGSKSSSGRNGGASESGGSAGSSAGTSRGGNSSGTGGSSSGTGGNSSGTGGNSSGTGGAQAGTGGSDGTTPEGFRAAFIRAACENLFTCGWGDDAFAMRMLLGTRERCVERYDARFGPFIGLRLDAVARGTLTFDAAEARHCLDVIPRACVLWETEEPLNAFQVTCGGVFEGTVAPGGDCASDEDCAGDAICYRDAFSEPTCLGHCAPKVAPGAACVDEIPCSTGGLEDATCGSDLTCATVALGDTVGEGEPCGLSPSGEHAFTLIPCASGTWCDRGDEPMGVCAPPIAIGAECPTEQAPCLDGALCSRDGSVDRCMALTIQSIAGTPCRAAEHEFCDPYSALVCTADVCEDPPGDCVTGFSCPEPEYCAESACAPKKGDGEECAGDDECGSALCIQRLANEPHRCYAPFCSEW